MNLAAKAKSVLRGQSPLLMAQNCRYSGYAIGKWTYGHPTVNRWDSKQMLTVGAFCSIAADVTIPLGGEHNTRFVSTFPFANFMGVGQWNAHEWSRGDVHIGNDVWIGHGALILSGAAIGEGAVIGAGAVVTKKVPPYAVIAGRPGAIVRYRFNPETIDALLRIRWWDWDDGKIRANIPLLMSEKIDDFVAAHAK